MTTFTTSRASNFQPNDERRRPSQPPKLDASGRALFVFLFRSSRTSLSKVSKWKPNGPQDYARSVQKWNIQALPGSQSENTLFYIRDSKLFRALPSTLQAYNLEQGQQHDHDGGKPSLIEKVEKLLHIGHSPKAVDASTPTSSSDSYSIRSTGGMRTVPVATTGEVPVPAEDVQNDLEWTVEVEVGTPPVKMKLDFDTGSADLWVFSTLLKLTTEQASEHAIYDPKKSSTAKALEGETWDISYGDGSSASGPVYQDTVTIGSVTIQAQAVETASKASESFLSPGSDGLLGLAFPPINTASPNRVALPVENMIAQKLIDEPIFTVNLQKDDAADGTDDSFYTFGFIDDSVSLSSAISYIPVDSSNGFWEFPTKSISIGKTTKARSTTAIADTGTTLLLLEDSVVTQLYKSIKGAKLSKAIGGWVVPSSAVLPDLGLEAGGKVYTIPGVDLKFADNGDGTWFGSVQSRGSNSQDIWGDVFLKRVYTVFDQGQTRIGFGQKKF